MAYHPDIANALRADLAAYDALDEQAMFGGLCFLLNRNMLCGVMADRAMFRVGKDNEARALLIEGVTPLSFTGRRMGGMVEVSVAASLDDACRAQLLGLALDFVVPMPPKVKKPRPRKA